MDSDTTHQTELTIDDLAAMLKIQFDEVNKQFDEVNKQFEWVKKELATKPSQHHVDARFDTLEKKINELAVEPSIRRDRTLNDKTNTVAHKLTDKSIFDSSDVSEIERISPVAVNPAT